MVCCQLWSFASLLCLATCVSGIDPFAVFVGVGSVFYENVYCRYAECCTDKTTKHNISGLEKAMQTQVYGQHLVQHVVYKSIRAHIRDPRPKKSLVLSFHGWTGGGKNLVASLVVNHLYALGSRSRFSHTFIASVHFPHDAHVQTYRDQLHSWVSGNVSKCARSIFVFDEADKMPIGLIDAIKPYIDFHDEINGVNYRHAIFIFLSNTAGNEITNYVYQQWQDGRDREDIKSSELEEIITKAAYNDKTSGLWHSSLLQQHLISHLVPFLPLMHQHAVQCAQDELKNLGRKPTQELTERIVDELQFFPADTKVYSKSGCKRIAEKARFILDGD